MSINVEKLLLNQGEEFFGMLTPYFFLKPGMGKAKNRIYQAEDLFSGSIIELTENIQCNL